MGKAIAAQHSFPPCYYKAAVSGTLLVKYLKVYEYYSKYSGNFWILYNRTSALFEGEIVNLNSLVDT